MAQKFDLIAQIETGANPILLGIAIDPSTPASTKSQAKVLVMVFRILRSSRPSPHQFQQRPTMRRSWEAILHSLRHSPQACRPASTSSMPPTAPVP